MRRAATVAAAPRDLLLPLNATLLSKARRVLPGREQAQTNLAVPARPRPTPCLAGYRHTVRDVRPALPCLLSAPGPTLHKRLARTALQSPPARYDSSR